MSYFCSNVEKNISSKCFEDTAIDQETTNSSTENEASPPKKKTPMLPNAEFTHKVENFMAFHWKVSPFILVLLFSFPYSNVSNYVSSKNFLSGNSKYAKRLIVDFKYLKIISNSRETIQKSLEEEEEKIATAAAEEGQTSKGKK